MRRYEFRRLLDTVFLVVAVCLSTACPEVEDTGSGDDPSDTSATSERPRTWRGGPADDGSAGGGGADSPTVDAGQDVTQPSADAGAAPDTGRGGDDDGGPLADPDMGSDDAGDREDAEAGGADATAGADVSDEPDPCVGLVCNSPRPDRCEPSGQLRVFDNPGVCRLGGCTYDSSLVDCEYGCKNGRCSECSEDGHCGGGAWCDSGTCRTCQSDTRCGAACTDCSEAGAHCSSDFTECVACRTSADCGSVERVCNEANECEERTCALPAEACSTGGGGNKRDCARAEVIGRDEAAAGYSERDDLWFSTIGDNQCSSAWGEDDFYRIFMFAGESIDVVLENDAWDNVDMILAIFASGTYCTGTTCDTMPVCEDDRGWSGDESVANFVASQDGWYTIKVDADDWIDDDGSYELKVTLRCNGADCGCP